MQINPNGNLYTINTLDTSSVFYIDKSKYIITANYPIFYQNEKIFDEYYGYGNEQIEVVKAYCRYNHINGFDGVIDSTYDYDIMLAVRAFQSNNNLIQNGCIDVATFNAMELNDSNNYNTYLRMATNYKQYQNPYGPSQYIIEENEVTFELMRNRAELAAQAYYDEQANAYNSMPAGEKIIRTSELLVTKGALEVLAEESYPYTPHLSDGLTHFLSNQGGVHYPIDSQDVFNQGNSNSFRNTYLEYTKDAIEAMLTIDKATDFSMVNAKPVALPKTIQSLDWYGLYGRYLFSVEGSCYKHGNIYVANGYCYARDYYDFDAIDMEYIVDFINSSITSNDEGIDKTDIVTYRCADLHYAGMARFFYIEGKDNGFTLTWSSNEMENNIDE